MGQNFGYLFSAVSLRGSFVYAVPSARGTTQDPGLLQSPPITKTLSQSVNNGGAAHSGSAGWIIDDNTRSMQWSLTGCDTSAAVGIVLERLHAP